MRVLVSPDKFAGSLTALQAARSIAAGWLRARPGDTVDVAPLADGGPGFLDCLHAALGGDLRSCRVAGPHGQPVTARLLVTGDTTYLEAADANGLALVPADRRDPVTTTTLGVGQALAAALAAGTRQVVIGLGGSATNDGGAGMLAALGATATDAAGVDRTSWLARGASRLPELAGVDLAPAVARLRQVRLVIASDVDSPLLGRHGASRGFARQKGADDAGIDWLEAALARWRSLLEAAGVPVAAADAAGAGAAGGLGYGLMALGGTRAAGAATVLRALELPSRCAAADLVITGEGKLDWQSLHGKVISAVVAAAGPTPVVVLAGSSDLPARAAGLAAVRTLVRPGVPVGRSISDAEPLLAELAAEVAAELPALLDESR